MPENRESRAQSDLIFNLLVLEFMFFLILFAPYGVEDELSRSFLKFVRVVLSPAWVGFGVFNLYVFGRVLTGESGISKHLLRYFSEDWGRHNQRLQSIVCKDEIFEEIKEALSQEDFVDDGNYVEPDERIRKALVKFFKIPENQAKLGDLNWDHLLVNEPAIFEGMKPLLHEAFQTQSFELMCNCIFNIPVKREKATDQMLFEIALSAIHTNPCRDSEKKYRRFRRLFDTVSQENIEPSKAIETVFERELRDPHDSGDAMFTLREFIKPEDRFKLIPVVVEYLSDVNIAELRSFKIITLIFLSGDCVPEWEDCFRDKLKELRAALTRTIPLMITSNVLFNVFGEMLRWVGKYQDDRSMGKVVSAIHYISRELNPHDEDYHEKITHLWIHLGRLKTLWGSVFSTLCTQITGKQASIRKVENSNRIFILPTLPPEVWLTIFKFMGLCENTKLASELIVFSGDDLTLLDAFEVLGGRKQALQVADFIDSDKALPDSGFEEIFEVPPEVDRGGCSIL